MKKLNKKGFTLIELIVVIAILAILAAILIPAVTGYIAKANDTRDQANCRALYSQLALEAMLGNDLSYDPDDEASGLTLDFTHDTTNSIITGFTCTKGTAVWEAPDFVK